VRRFYQFKSKIDNIFQISKAFYDDEIKANISQHLCILTSGFLELAIKEIIIDYSSNKAAPSIQNYIESSLQNLTNLKVAKIIDFLNKFNQDWGIELESSISDEQKDAVDALIANRNNIAHGKNVGISYVGVKRYYERTQEVIEIVDKIINK
jgi:hypothetical protein